MNEYFLIVLSCFHHQQQKNIYILRSSNLIHCPKLRTHFKVTVSPPGCATCLLLVPAPPSSLTLILLHLHQPALPPTFPCIFPFLLSLTLLHIDLPATSSHLFPLLPPTFPCLFPFLLNSFYSAIS